MITTSKQHSVRRLAFVTLVCLGLACDDDKPKPIDPLDAAVFIPDAYLADAPMRDIGFGEDALADASGVITPDLGTGIDAGQHVYETIVLLDGVPAPNTIVLQGGTEQLFRTDEDGRAFVPVDRTMEGDIWVLASHPQARIWGA